MCSMKLGSGSRGLSAVILTAPEQTRVLYRSSMSTWMTRYSSGVAPGGREQYHSLGIVDQRSNSGLEGIHKTEKTCSVKTMCRDTWSGGLGQQQ